MNLRRKKPRPLTRGDGTVRDATLCIIATEDTYAPDHYFRLFKNTRIQVVVLPTEDGRSAPEHVLERLDRHCDEYDVGDGDDLWLMLDTDHWTEPDHVDNFTRVCREAMQKGYRLAHSNPCFEIWLLLHLADVGDGEEFQRCEDVVERIKQIIGEYSKKKIDPEYFNPASMADAVRRAEAMAVHPDGRWPQQVGTHVYKVVRDFL